MEEKYLKDFVIILIVLSLIAFGMKNVSLYTNLKEVPKESKYKELGLGDKLLSQIKEIEESIQDRKDFEFTVEKDPLEQNLIVKTMKDLQAQWHKMIENMVHLESTIIPEVGKRRAVIAYQGKANVYKVGDNFEKGKITAINQGEITYSYRGSVGKIKVKKLPAKPVELQTTSKTKSNREYNW